MADIHDQVAAKRFPTGKKIEGPLPWEVRGVENQFNGKFVGLKEVAFVAPGAGPNGTDKKEWRSIVMMPDGMMTVPVTPDGKVVLVRVLRPGAGTQHWEFPQERWEEGGDPIQGAVRCGREEAGLVGDPIRVKHVINMPSMADRVTEITHVYVVVGNYDLNARTDKDEIADGAVAMFSLDEVIDLIKNGEMSCCCNIAAALLVNQRRAELGIR